METSRLLTLAGMGGIGKTRLALQAAHAVRRAFPDGVWLVDVATVHNEEGLADQVAAALWLKDRTARPIGEQVAEHVAARSLLIVMDNCEHVVDACATLLDGLLRRAPGLRVLATSRQPLGIPGEQVFVVPPLRAPDPNQEQPLETMVQYDSVALLVERAGAVQPGFTLDAGNREAAAQVCARLDGLPLAIELAAARLRSLSLQQVADRLDDRFRFLTRGSTVALSRQRDLRALIDHSYELCGERERLLWGRLSVFPGEFDLDAVEGVCAGDGLDRDQVVDALDDLVAKSIVTVRPDHPRVRYRLLETIRLYGHDLLVQVGRDREMHRRHRDYHLALAVAECASWCGPGQNAALERLRLEHDNYVAALDWSLSDAREAETALVLVSALRCHWFFGGFLAIGRRRLDHALDLATEPTAARGTALWVAAWVTLVQGDQEAAVKRLDECESLATGLGDDHLLAYVLVMRGTVAVLRAQTEEAVRLLDAGARGMRGAGDDQGVLLGLFQLGMALSHSGDSARALAACEEAIRISDDKGEAWGRAQALWTMAMDHWRRGDPQQVAADLLHEAMALTPEVDGPLHAIGAETLAGLALSTGRHTEAARMLGRAAAVRQVMGSGAEAFAGRADCPAREYRSIAEHALGAEAFQQAFDEGWTSPVVSGSVRSDALDLQAPRRGVSPTRLTPREAQVALLIAKGMTNKEIAASLVVSPRTVDGHVERLFGKIGVKSRAQIAVWAAEQGAGRL
ncbi:LuxR C-terminal-related transcriptional regulator [Streptomyces sp. NPDC047061]|uniref:ATP-binding protein n=1 Tax=Streptomyces sp. NPDC047061 TaxID=3154605 RepID=UPI0033F12970